MLSYQHAYHAGSRVDIHKHDILARVLELLRKEKTQLSYLETHAGRAIYNLGAKEADKTGEAALGWLKLVQNKNLLSKLSPSYIEAVRTLNKGKLMPRYPGSPLIAAHILRPHDKIRLFELHPTENTALRKNMADDKRVTMEKRDGLEGVLANIPKGKGVVLVDPSYEVKSDYDAIAEFVTELHKRWPQGVILAWVPMLTANRHGVMVEKIMGIGGMKKSEIAWAKPGEVRGMYGSIIMGINADAAFQTSFAPYISEL
jgi:23S rRNA (adenine2030-N6)-methyltransferase